MSRHINIQPPELRADLKISPWFHHRHRISVATLWANTFLHGDGSEWSATYCKGNIYEGMESQ
jgi:hypothetical protein